VGERGIKTQPSCLFRTALGFSGEALASGAFFYGVVYSLVHCSQGDCLILGCTYYYGLGREILQGVDRTGFEPVASSLQMRRSTN
jgi:hypothetical protein